jgi:signal transduction histidine kinase
MRDLIPHPTFWKKAGVLSGALASIVALGVLDFATGRELAISAFYLAPICWGTWHLGRRAGVALSTASALIWLAADLTGNQAYEHPAILYWNALMLLGLFLPVAWLLASFHDAHRHLEKIVEVRTTALRLEIEERRRLEKEKIQAERLAMVGTMAAQVAHEVRNPLGAVTMTLDLIEQEIDVLDNPGRHPTAEVRSLVNDVREEVHRIDHVVTDYLALARPRKAIRVPLELPGFLLHKLSLLRGTFDRASVKLNLELDRQPVAVRADSEQLWQALLNLIRNSLDAMPHGGSLGIGLKHEGDFAVLRVTDTGDGMTVAQQERLFVPFTTTKATGTGLGLSLVQQLVTGHEGRIVCVSNPGEGTTFLIFLPIFHGAAPISETHTQSMPIAAEPIATL